MTPPKTTLHFVVMNEEALIPRETIGEMVGVRVHRREPRTSSEVGGGNFVIEDLEDLRVSNRAELFRDVPELVAEHAALECSKGPLCGLQRSADEEEVLGANTQAPCGVGELEPGVEVVPHVVHNMAP